MKVEFVKNDSGKPRFELLPALATEEVAKVLTKGAIKYTHDGIDGSDNWRIGTNWRRYLGAALRHVFAFLRGEDLDPETGYSHLAHAVCCLLFLLEFQLGGGGTDDRVKVDQAEPEPVGGLFCRAACTANTPCTRHKCSYQTCNCRVPK